MARGIGAAQRHDGEAHEEEGAQRAAVRHRRQLAHREKGRRDGHAQAGDDRHHVRRAIFRVHLRQHAGQQAIAAHHEEHAGLREHHHEHDRRQRETGRQAEHVAHAGMADGAQHVRQRFVGANNRQSGFGKGLALGHQFRRTGLQGFAVRAEHRLRAIAADHAGTHQHVENGADGEAGNQPDRDVALWILGFFGRGGHRIEAHEGKEDDGSRTNGASGAQGQEGFELVGRGGRNRQEDERRQRDHLHGDQHGVDCGAFLGAQHQQPGDRERNDHGGQVDDAAGIRPGHQFGRQLNAEEVIKHADHVAGPADRHGRSRHGIFQHQRPADDPGENLAEGGIAVGVGAARHRHHRGQFGIAEGGEAADQRRQHEADQHARSGQLRGFGREHENAGADDAANAQHGELERPQRAGERFLLCGRQDRIQRLHAPFVQAISPCQTFGAVPHTMEPTPCHATVMPSNGGRGQGGRATDSVAGDVT